MSKITQDEANDIVNRMLDTEHGNNKCDGLWLLGDMIEGIPYAKCNHANIRAIKILESMDQDNEDVKNLREYLEL